MDNRPIGVFDSGQGGLSVVKHLIDSLKNQSIIYFGDTARVPYGTKSAATIEKYAKQDIAFLMNKNVKAIVVACGTVSSYLTPELFENLNVPFTGVLKPASLAAVKNSTTGTIGVIGTKATVKSKSYEKEILLHKKDAKVVSVACPMFVPLVENGYIQPDNKISLAVAKDYLLPFQKENIDVLILGCTHFPLLKGIIEQAVPNGIKLIDPGYETALFIEQLLKKNNLLPSADNKAVYEFNASDDVENFKEGADIFLGDKLKTLNASFNQVTF